MISRAEYIKQLREKYPNRYPSNAPDSYVYRTGRKSNPNVDVEDWELAGYVGGKKVREPSVDISPNGWNELGLVDINDNSWEWLKHAYANSLQGTLRAWKDGNLDYTMKDYEDLNVLEKAGAGFASFLMPLDLLSLVGGGFLTKTALSIGKKAVGKKILNDVAVKGALAKAESIAVKKGLGKGVLEGAFKRSVLEANTLGMYEGAKAGLAADMNGEDVFSAIGKAYAHGSILGGIMGGTGGMLEGNFLRYKMLKEARVAGDIGGAYKGGFSKHYKIPEIEKLMKYTGPGAQYAAEVGVLQASSLPELISSGQFSGEKLLEDFIVNAGFVGLMKGKRKLTSKMYEPVAESLDRYKKEFAKAIEKRDKKDLKSEKDLANKTEEGLENTALGIEGTDPASAKEIRNAKNEINKAFDTKPEEKLIEGMVNLQKVIDFIDLSKKLSKDDALVTNPKEMAKRVKAHQNNANEAYQNLLQAKKDGVAKGNLLPKIDRILKDLELESETWTKYKTKTENTVEDRKEEAKNWWLETDAGKLIPKKAFEASLKKPDFVDRYIKQKETVVDKTSDPIVEKIEKRFGLANVTESKKIAKNIIKDIDKKIKSGTATSEEKSLSKRNKQFKDMGVKRDDNLALVSYADKGVRENKHSFQVGKFLEWFKDKSRGKGWKSVKKEDVYDYLYKHVLEGEGKNKIVGEDIAPFSNFGKWMKGEWVNKNQVEGISYKEANELRFQPVVEREVSKKLVGTAVKAKPRAIKKAAKEWGGTSGQEVDVIAELMFRGVRPQEINKLSASDFKKAPDGRYYIDMRSAKKWGTGVRLKIKIPKETYDLAKKIGKEIGDKKAFTGKKNINTKDVKGKSLLKAIAEELYGKKDAASNDMRTALEQLKVGVAEDKLTQQELDAYLGHITEKNATAIKDIYKAVKRPLKEQLDIAEKVESVLGIGVVPKPKKTKLKAPMPPKPEVETVISKIKKIRKIHEKQKEKKSFLQKFSSSVGEQKQVIAKKDVIIDALRGEFYKKQPALESLKEFINNHKDWIKKIKQNPDQIKKKFGDEAGDIAWHKEQINTYNRAVKLIKEAKETELPYDTPRGKAYGIIHQGQKTLGIERSQLGKKAYETNLFKDTKDALGKGVKSLAKLSTDDAIDYYNMINSKTYKAPETNWRAREYTVKEMAAQRGFTKSDLKDMLIAVDVKDGKWENIKSKHSIDQVLAFLSTHEITKHPPSVSELMVNFAAESFLKFPSTGRRMVTPIWSLLKNPKIGGKLGSKIADSFLEWDVTNARERGKSSAAMGKIKNLIGKDAHMLQFFDVDKVKLWKKDMSPEEITFVKRMNDNTKVLNKKTGKKEFKNKERRALEIWDNYRKGAWNRMFEYTKGWSNPAMAQRFRDKMNEKFVDSYFTRRLSDEALYAITTLKDQPILEKIAKSKMTEYLKSKTKNLSQKPNESPDMFDARVEHVKEKIRNHPDTVDKIKTDVMTYLQMPHHQIYNNFFMERGILLPRKIQIYDKNKNLKTVKTYDESFSGTAEYYGFSMAKYLSTLRHFPEVTELGRKFKLGNWKRNMFDILTSQKERGKLGVNHQWADYLTMTLEAHLDMKTSAQQRHDAKLNRWLGTLSSTGAAAGLSTPILHGVKNLVLGFENSVRHYGMVNTLDGMRRYFDINERQRLIEGGVAEYFSGQVLRTQKNIFEQWGITEKMPGGKILTMDWMFKNWNMMTRSEEFARISSAFAGGLHFHQMLDAYKGVKNSLWFGEGKKGNIEDSFRNVYKLSEDQIKWIKNTKHKDFNTKENTAKMVSIMQKVEHYSHVSAQGGTSTILLPLWMSKGVAKPLTLFTRIATAVTHDIWMNGVRPLQKHGNIMPLLRYSATSAISGAGLYYLYKNIMGQDQMHQFSDDRWKTVLQFLWKAEFFGMFTDALLNPNVTSLYSGGKLKVGIDDPKMLTSLFQPYMIRAGIVTTQGLAQLASNPTSFKTWKQTMDSILKNTVSFYNQAGRQWDRRLFPDKHEWRGIRTAARSFKKEKGYEVKSSFLATSRTVYYNDLKNNFWYGSEKDFVKSYYDAFSFIDSEYESQGFTNESYRRKKTMRSIESSIKSMHPVNLSLEKKGRTQSIRNEFLDYLKKHDIKEYRKALKSEKEYNIKLRRLLAATKKAKYRLRYSPYYDR